MEIRTGRIRLDASHLISASSGLAVGLLGGYLVGRLLAKHKAVEEASWRIASEVEAAKEHYRQRELALLRSYANVAGKGDNPHQRAATALGDRRNRPTGPPLIGPGSVGYDRAGLDSGESPRYVPLLPDDDEDTDPRSELEGLSDAGEEDDDDGDEDYYEDGEDGTDPDIGSPSDRPEPHIISKEQYAEEFLTASKVTLTWYEKGDTLADEDGQPVSDRTRIFGREFTRHFDKDPEEPDIVHVRNRRIDTDFEIVRNRGSYSEVVLNYGRPQ